MTDHRETKTFLYEQVARIGKSLGSPKRLELIELLSQEAVAKLPNFQKIMVTNKVMYIF